MTLRLYADGLLTDLDGVLADSTAPVEYAWRWWAQRVSADADTVIAQAHGARSAETIARVRPDLDLAVEVAALEARELDLVDGTRPVPGAVTLVGSVPPDRWAVVTSGSRAVATARLRAVGLAPPEVLVTADDVAVGKPDPTGYLDAAAALGLDAARCVVLEDSPTGIAAGRAAGATVVAVATSHEAGHLRAEDHVIAELDALVVRCPGMDPHPAASGE